MCISQYQGSIKSTEFNIDTKRITPAMIDLLHALNKIQIQSIDFTIKTKDGVPAIDASTGQSKSAGSQRMARDHPCVSRDENGLESIHSSAYVRRKCDSSYTTVERTAFTGCETEADYHICLFYANHRQQSANASNFLRSPDTICLPRLTRYRRERTQADFW